MAIFYPTHIQHPFGVDIKPEISPVAIGLFNAQSSNPVKYIRPGGNTRGLFDCQDLYYFLY